MVLDEFFAMAPSFIFLLIAGVSFTAAIPVESIIRDTSTNSTISCNWSNAADIVGDIQTNKLNATDVVTQCVSVCGIVFASDNPDISKNGVFVSAIIQVALACLFGPLFPILLWLTNSFPSSISRWIPLLRNVQQSVYEINAFFCISIIVAAFVLHHQDKSILEVTFTSELLSMQLVLIGTMLWAQYGDHLMHNRRGSKLGDPWNFYYIGIFIFQVTATSVLGFPDRTVAVYKQLAKECHIQRGLVDVSGYLGTSSFSNSPAKWLGIGLGIGACLGILLCIIAIAFAGLSKKIAAILPKWLRKNGLKILITALILFYVALVMIHIVILGQFREKWKSMRKDLTQDEAWGYGQTMAILIWAPFVWAAVKDILKQSKEPASPTQPEAEMQNLDPETAVPQMAETVPPPYSHGNGPPSSTLQ